ncbi:MAG: hypothetical protein ACRDV3_12830 [Acidothermaceae bacterium]
MASGAQPARLTIQFREPLPRAVAAEIVHRAHAAGLLSATIHRGSAARLRAVDIPAPRSLSLADEEGTTIAVIAPEHELATFAATIADVAGKAELFIEVGRTVREFRPVPTQ